MPDAPGNAPDTPAGFLARNSDRIGLAVLFAYVILLAVGTAGEVFHVRWILDLPIY